MKVQSLFAAAAAAVLAAAAPAAADPPPLPVAVTFYLPDDSSGGIAAEAKVLHERLIDDGWFARTPSTLSADALAAACGDRGWGESLIACLRGQTAPTRGKGAPEVVVAVVVERDGHTRLRCLGPGAADTTPERQSVLVDLIAARGDRSTVDRQAAAGCIIAAAAESGW